MPGVNVPKRIPSLAAYERRAEEIARNINHYVHQPHPVRRQLENAEVALNRAILPEGVRDLKKDYSRVARHFDDYAPKPSKRYLEALEQANCFNERGDAVIFYESSAVNKRTKKKKFPNRIITKIISPDGSFQYEIHENNKLLKTISKVFIGENSSYYAENLKDGYQTVIMKTKNHSGILGAFYNKLKNLIVFSNKSGTGISPKDKKPIYYDLSETPVIIGNHLKEKFEKNWNKYIQKL